MGVAMLRPDSAGVRDRIRLDLFGAIVAIERPLVIELRDAAAARAGASSRYRDLSLLLDRSLSTGTLTPRRHEFRLMVRLAAAGAQPLQALARDLREAAGQRAAD